MKRIAWQGRKRKSTMSSYPKTRGSNPCHVRIQWMRLFYYRPRFLFISVFGVLVALQAASTLSWWFGLLVLVPACVLLCWMNVKKLAFDNGTTNPAIVLSVRPFLVAVYANMSNRHGFIPAIKVMRLRNPCVEVAPGDRLLAAATYQRHTSVDLPGWIDVHPVLLAEATNDRKAIERAMELVDAVEWSSLQDGLDQVPTPYEPDIYFVDLVTKEKPFHENR